MAKIKFALMLRHDEAEDPEHSYHWTGWKKHHWLEREIRPGVRFYGFDKDTRRLCVLLEVTKGGSFTYRSRKDFEKQVTRLTHWPPDHDAPQWSRIPHGGKKSYIGFAIRWKFVRWVDNPRWEHNFPQIGWERLEEEPRPRSIEDDVFEMIGRKDLTETVKQRLVNSRLGQGDFRKNVLRYWKGCAVTNCKQRNLLKASHIKPWRECNNHERLDPFNGLALIPNLDAAFDQGLISFQDNGRILISPHLDKATQATLGISPKMQIKRFKAQHLRYLRYHRKNVFRR